jgi:hypothetical protein
MDYKQFFSSDNKSGWKTKESILKIKEPEIYNKIKDFTNNNFLGDLSFKQQIWHFINNEPSKKVCLGCGKDVEFRDSITKGYRKFCSLSCANESGLLNDFVKKSNLEKYGVSYYSQHKDFASKVKKTKKQKYGNENYNNIQKVLLTKEQKYGDKKFNNKEKKKITTRNNFIQKVNLKTSDELIKYEIEDSFLTFKCSSCGNNYEIYNTLFNYRTEYGIKVCTICNPINSTDSFHQKEITDFVRGLYSYNMLLETREIIPPYELDIYIPELKLAIEFDGLYWHSNKFVPKNYHLNKTKLCRELGIDLIHIFEDEWIYKKEIVKSILRTKILNQNNSIYARKCIVKRVNNGETKTFLETNHIQGHVNSKFNFGLYYNDELVSLITFGGLRKSLGSLNLKGNFELLRFVNKLNTNVIGGFSRLLKYFIKQHNPSLILTFSDNRYFDGQVYSKNNFEFLGETSPNYWYIEKHKRHHRFKFRKDILVKKGYDKNKSESQIMEERGINKIYDCGNKKWILRF